MLSYRVAFAPLLITWPCTLHSSCPTLCIPHPAYSVRVAQQRRRRNSNVHVVSHVEVSLVCLCVFLFVVVASLAAFLHLVYSDDGGLGDADRSGVGGVGVIACLVRRRGVSSSKAIPLKPYPRFVTSSRVKPSPVAYVFSSFSCTTPRSRVVHMLHNLR